MTLSLLSPLALALGVLVGLPILAHLSRRRPTQRRAFGAMLLLRRIERRLRRRRRVTDPLLLLLRALAVLFVVLAATAPQVILPADPPEVGGSGRVVLLLDRSMSMGQVDGGATLLQQARGMALRRLDALPEGVRLGLVIFADDVQVVTSELTTDRERLRAALADVQPAYTGGDLRGALLEARRLLGGEVGEVVVFSDEAGPAMVPAAADEITRIAEAGSAVVPVPVSPATPRNLAVAQATYTDGVEGGQVVLRVVNYGPDATEAACEVLLPDGASIPIFVDLPPQGPAEARVTVPREAEGGVGRVRCDDADLPLDDAFYFHLPQVGASRVLVVDGDPGDTPIRSEVYFLERALAPWGTARGAVVPDVVAPVGLTELDPEVHRVVFLANVSDPRPFAARLREFVRKGGNVVLFMGDNVTPDRYNEALGGFLPSSLRRPRALADRAEDPIPFELPDVEHPLFEPFRRGGRAAFARAGAWRAMTLDPYQDGGDVHTLLRYQGGVPALVEREIGAGRVLLFTSTADLGWTNLPLEAVYMPLVQRTVSWLGGARSGADITLDARVGQRVQIELPEGITDAEVEGPDGQPVRSQREASNLLIHPARPGGYLVRSDAGLPLAQVAVNTDPAESDVRRTHTIQAVESEVRPELFQRRADLSGWLLGGGLLLLLASALLGARSRPSAAHAEPSVASEPDASPEEAA